MEKSTRMLNYGKSPLSIQAGQTLLYSGVGTKSIFLEANML